MLSDLKKVMVEFKGLLKELDLDISQDVFVDCSVRIYNTTKMNKETKEIEQKEVLATEKQKQTMKKLKIKYPDSVTKKEASKLIEEKIKKINESKNKA